MGEYKFMKYEKEDYNKMKNENVSVHPKAAAVCST